MTQFDKGFDQLDTFIRERMAITRTPGFAAAFFEQQQIVYVGTYGYADLETQIPVVPETLFEIGSITKSFTAVAVLKAVDQGLLDLQRLWSIIYLGLKSRQSTNQSPCIIY